MLFRRGRGGTHMSATTTLSKKALAKRSEGDAETKGSARKRPPAHPYNIALVCGSMVQIFTPDRFHELPKEVERLMSWGNKLHEIDLQLLESDDPFQ